ncbi:MAG TPA: PRC-barrel domain-containing protein [Salinarimonas sp.]|jgi:broad specificity phosphatase PhoE|nr:PRC-barrel domain-containing protein [Salinarimonas sp.]
MSRAAFASLLVWAMLTAGAGAQVPGPPAQEPYGTPGAAAPPPAGAPAGPGPQQVAASRLKELKLYTAQNQPLGAVERVVAGSDGAIGLVVAHGGFLGLGERHVLVPAAHVGLRDDRLVAVNLNDEQLRALPIVGRENAALREIDDAHQVPVGASP